ERKSDIEPVSIRTRTGSSLINASITRVLGTYRKRRPRRQIPAGLESSSANHWR
ncbi:10404_t:CDS:1, partial [Acaulospora colombiana]